MGGHGGTFAEVGGTAGRSRWGTRNLTPRALSGVPVRLRVPTPPYRRGEEEEARQACGVSVTDGVVGGGVGGVVDNTC